MQAVVNKLLQFFLPQIVLYGLNQLYLTFFPSRLPSLQATRPFSLKKQLLRAIDYSSSCPRILDQSLPPTKPMSIDYFNCLRQSFILDAIFYVKTGIHFQAWLVSRRRRIDRFFQLFSQTRIEYRKYYNICQYYRIIMITKKMIKGQYGL